MSKSVAVMVAGLPAVRPSPSQPSSPSRFRARPGPRATAAFRQTACELQYSTCKQTARADYQFCRNASEEELPPALEPAAAELPQEQPEPMRQLDSGYPVQRMTEGVGKSLALVSPIADIRPSRWSPFILRRALGQSHRRCCSPSATARLIPVAHCEFPVNQRTRPQLRPPMYEANRPSKHTRKLMTKLLAVMLTGLFAAGAYAQNARLAHRRSNNR